MDGSKAAQKTSRTRGRFRLCAAVALALVACGGSDSGPVARGDILLLSVDTLRPDHLGIYGYPRSTSPNIDRFFASGTVYERAYGTTASTGPSVVSLLTGRLPQDHRVRLLYQLVPDEVPLVTDLLPERYQKAAFVSNIVLTDEALGVADRFDYYDDYVDQRESVRAVWERNAARTTDAALAWLREERDPARPLFLWVHYIDPHGPYRAPPGSGVSFRHSHAKRPFSPRRIASYMAEDGFDDAWRYVDHYDEEISYTDAQIGRLLEGYGPGLDTALVIFTADHGETMIEHEKWFTHGYQVYEAILRVPLLLRGPSVPTRRVSEPAQGTDVAPTLLRFAGVEPPETMPGVDLRTAAGLEPERRILLEATGRDHQWRAIVQGDEKWSVMVRGPRRTVKRRRYAALGAGERDVRSGPWRGADSPAAELLELVETDPDPSGVPRDVENGSAIRAPKVDPRVDAQTLEKLKTLGYAE